MPRYIGLDLVWPTSNSESLEFRSNGMATVDNIAFSYPFGQMKDHIEMKRQGWEHKAIGSIRTTQKAALRRMMIDVFFKKTLQLKLQVTLYGLQRAMRTHMDAEGSWGCRWFKTYVL